ncbi:DUF2125 domain-containing protein [Oceanibium sediminis]|uniref:DUF2125 domain-containing protein n=1 Tax=Oceanibium sediminis TaxID=2026339 RepID=UPI0013008571|nr:DUF2125 domain-containing protein [Oceanibium sediminis]
MALALAAPTGAFAQMTPQDYLEEMAALYAAQGMNFSYASAEESGDALIVSDIALSMDNEQVQTTISFEEMTIRPTAADGYDLEVEASPDYIGSVTTVTEGEEFAFDFEVTARGLYRVGGPEDSRRMELEYPEVSLSYHIATGAPEDMPPMDVSATLRDLTGNFSYALGAMTQTYDIAAANFGVSMSMEEASGHSVGIELSYDDVTMTGAGPITNMNDSSGMFAADTVSSFELRAATSMLDMTATEDGADTDIRVEGGASSLAMEIGDGVLDYAIAQDAMKVNVSGAALPMPPVEVSIDRLDTRFAMPMLPTDDAKDMALRLNIEGLTVDEALWAMVDTGGAVPRYPANLTLDVTGMGKALVDMTSGDPEAMMAGGMPMEFESVTLNTLLMSFGGAEVTGSGEATINNSGFMPMPVGGIDFRLEGVTTLAGKLVETGLLQQAQVMPLQMMLGMFAKPTGEADTFESRLEMTAEGNILANGVPLQ